MTQSIGVYNSFPNVSSSAEKELIIRLILSGDRLGAKITPVITSDDIFNLNPDFVLALHEVNPKLTPLTTVGTLWNPPQGIRHDEVRCDFLRSYDGYLTASSSVETFVRDELFCASNARQKPVADFHFYPSSPSNVAEATGFSSLVYLGVHWDGKRHNDLLGDLARRELISFYGPGTAWRHVQSSYRSALPFDGQSVIRCLAQHGIVLCLHRESHVLANTPSMRLFEAASAGCLIISDSIPFARETFSDTIFVLPEDGDAAGFVEEKVAWAKSYPKLAREMAQESKAIFDQNLSLDVLLPKAIDFSQSVKNSNKKVAGNVSFALFYPRNIDLICYIKILRKSQIFSLFKKVGEQTARVSRIIVLYDSLEEEVSIKFFKWVHPKVILLRRTSSISDQTLSILSHIKSRYVASIDLDVDWSTEHLSSLMNTIKDNITKERFGGAYALCVLKLWEGAYIDAPNFRGDNTQIIKESRSLARSYKLPDELPDCPHSCLDFMCRGDWLIPAVEFKSIWRNAHNLINNRDQNRSAQLFCSGWVTAFRNNLDPKLVPTIVFS